MRLLSLALVFSAGLAGTAAEAPYERLLRASDDPANWLTYSGGYFSHRHSKLDSITLENVHRLELAWVFQAQSLEKFEATPLVVDGVMYTTEPPNTVVALDARTGRVFWTYEHSLPSATTQCCGRVNRGLAILGDLLYMGTIDARLLAIDSRTGKLRWQAEMADYTQGYAVTVAPLAVKDMVLAGVAGGEYGIRGFLDAYDAKSGKRRWRFYTIPGPGEPGHESWENDAWKTGGGSIWLTGSYDPELNLTYWGTGNPSPDWNPSVRPGDNLYTDSVIALDADSGKLRWHFQFTPHDEWDWDAVQIPVLVDAQWRGVPRKLLYWANRNGFFYVLDRATGEFLLGKPFVRQSWARGLDAAGRPVKIPGMGPSTQGTKVYPGVQGGTNWYSPSYSPRTGLFYLSAWEYFSYYFKRDQEYVPGLSYTGGYTKADVPATRRQRIHLWDSEAGYGAVRALDPRTGEKVWEYRTDDVSDSGILTTAANVLFSGSREGYFFALDAGSGTLLWKKYLGGQMAASPVTYAAGGRQYVAIAAGHSLFVFSLPEN